MHVHLCQCISFMSKLVLGRPRREHAIVWLHSYDVCACMFFKQAECQFKSTCRSRVKFYLPGTLFSPSWTASTANLRFEPFLSSDISFFLYALLYSTAKAENRRYQKISSFTCTKHVGSCGAWVLDHVFNQGFFNIAGQNEQLPRQTQTQISLGINPNEI